MSAQPRLDEWQDLSLEDIRSSFKDGTLSGEEALEALEQTPEQINEAGSRAFLAKHPEFPVSKLNGELMQTWLDERDVPATVKNLEIAWRTLAAEGWLEKPMPEAPADDDLFVDGDPVAPTDQEAEPTVTVRRWNVDGSSEAVDFEAEVQRLRAIAADRLAPDAVRKNADDRIKFLVRTHISQTRKPRLNEQLVVI